MLHIRHLVRMCVAECRGVCGRQEQQHTQKVKAKPSVQAVWEEVRPPRVCRQVRTEWAGRGGKCGGRGGWEEEGRCGGKGRLGRGREGGNRRGGTEDEVRALDPGKPACGPRAGLWTLASLLLGQGPGFRPWQARAWAHTCAYGRTPSHVWMLR
eukprot:350246-Chlamydomonas_euryale.AAC.2